MSHDLNHSARCYELTYQDSPVAFCAVLPHGFIKDARRVSRFVVLPKFQSCGTGLTFLEAIGNEYIKAKMQFTISTRHLAVIKSLQKRKDWFLIPLTAAQLAMLLEGIEPLAVKERKRFALKNSS